MIKKDTWFLVLVTRLFLLGSQFEMFCALDAKLLLRLALLALQTKDDLTGGLGLFVKDRLGLTTESHLFGIVSALSLGKIGSLSRLVLGHLVNLVAFAFL